MVNQNGFVTVSLYSNANYKCVTILYGRVLTLLRIREVPASNLERQAILIFFVFISVRPDNAGIEP
jgi:hypothetical protein